MNVTIYSTPTCPFCKLTKEFLTKHKVEYTDIDVSADQAAASEMIKKTGQMGVPVVEIGDQTIIGFDEKKLRAALGLNKKTA